MIPYGRQNISQADIDSVVAILKSDFITQGPAIEQFEKAIASYTGASYVVAVSSATAALHISCLSLGIGPGDLVWTSPNTFVASANCALYCGADIDFVDIDERTYNLSVARLEEKLANAKKSGRLPKALIAVHFSGQSCKMDKIHDLSKRYGFKIIEDASHAIGGKYKNKPVGSCDYSDMAVFSFHPVKIITTGEGGVVVTNNKDLYDRLILFRSHGVTKEPALMSKNDGPWYYEQIELGFNYRMTDFQAALGVSQMHRLDMFVQKRHELAVRYNELLRDLPVEIPFQQQNAYSAYHLYIIRLRLDVISRSHKEVFEGLRDSGIGVQLHYIPVHLQPYYRKLGFSAGDFPVAERYYTEAISLPMYYDLTYEEQAMVVAIIKRILM